MTDNVPVSPVVLPDGQPRKRGRPKGARPLCEKDELAKYPDPKIVVWGIQPECKRFKRKGLAILYNPEHKGGMVTLMPVTDDGGELRWRYRGVPGPCPFRYEKIDLEPGQAGGLPGKLRELADTIEGVVKTHFGDTKGADQTTRDFHEKVKAGDISERLRKLGWG